MINRGLFKSEIEKMEQACGQTLLSAGKALWYQDLIDEGFNDEDFKKGITDTRRGAGRFFPTLATLIENCRLYYNARMEKEGYLNRRKDEDNAVRLFDNSLANTPGRKLFCDVLYGRITKEEAIEEMRELDKEYPGKGWADQAAELERGA